VDIVEEEPRIDPSDPVGLLRQMLFCVSASIGDFGLIPSLRAAIATIITIARLRTKNHEEFHPGITVITFTIHPDLARIWYWFFSRVADPSTKIVIVDCRGNLSPAYFPRARVARFCNFQHGRKIDYWVYYVLSTLY